jgi:hypothetical protein
MHYLLASCSTHVNPEFLLLLCDISIAVEMALPEDVLKAWEACDRTDTLFVLVCSVFCGYTISTIDAVF